jgi:hypothetical protein
MDASMKKYRIYKFGSDGFLQNGWDFEADDDEHAKELASLQLDDCSRIEIWDDIRQICDLRGML